MDYVNRLHGFLEGLKERAYRPEEDVAADAASMPALAELSHRPDLRDAVLCKAVSPSMDEVTFRQVATRADLAKVTGTPLVECPVSDNAPYSANPDGDTAGENSMQTVTGDGKVLCEDTQVTSNTDDWNAISKSPASTGNAIAIAAGVMALLLTGGSILVIVRRRTGTHAGAHTVPGIR